MGQKVKVKDEFDFKKSERRKSFCEIWIPGVPNFLPDINVCKKRVD